MPRIVTYNVHRCVGNDRQLDVARVADVLARLEPDIVALQELDVGRARTNHVDQATEIAERLEMACRFHPAMRVEEELYGDAILTAYPERLIQTGPLPGHPRLPQLEPRGALWLEVEIEGVPVQVINTHLGLLPGERLAQAEALLGSEWLRGYHCRGPVILLGDFNAGPSSRAYRLLASRFRDAQGVVRPTRRQATFPTRAPFRCIDHVFVSPGITIRRSLVPRTPLTRLASDHLPLIVEVEL